jgi:hypothetical protein
MDFDNAINHIVSKVKELGIGTRLSYKEVNQWLELSSGDDLMWDYDKLSDRLTIEHSICLELKKDHIITALPDGSDVEAAVKRFDQSDKADRRS